MLVSLKNAGKNYGCIKALEGLTFDIEKGDIVSFIGPSGSGKTTLLKLLAELEEPSEGEVIFHKSVSREHPAVMVFQDYLLFPHMNIFDNVAFGLKSRKLDKAVIKDKVCTFLEYFGIPDKAKSYPRQLSAGQQQRAAIARAMVIEPALLLLDEPFANLDKNLKAGTAEFIRGIQKKLGTTTVSVTHDQEEAFAMSDRIGILTGGKLIQFGTTRDVYYSPASYEAARFLGPVNRVPSSLYSTLGIISDSDESCIRAEALSAQPDPHGPGRIVNITFSGAMILLDIDIDGFLLKSASFNGNLNTGDRVALAALHYFKEGE